MGFEIAGPPRRREARVDLPSGVVTFLLTDVVGSTRLWDTAPEAMSLALDRHDRLVEEAVTARGGVLVKARGEGDSTFSVFRRASDAVGVAIDLRRALAAEPWPTGAPLVVRIAVHTGEAVERRGDYYGGTVNRVARLRASAEPGQIVVSDTTAGLVADHRGDGWRLAPLGRRVLEGLSRPEDVHEVVVAGAAAPGGGAAPAGPRAAGVRGPAPGLDLRVLGRFDVLVAGEAVDLGPPKQRAVLAVLLLEAGRVVPSERLVELLWGDAPKALVSLQTYVSNLRRALEPQRRPRDPARVLVTQAPGYRLDVDRSQVDALRFEDLVTAGGARLRAGDPAAAVEVLDEALALWAGPPLPELAHEPFVVDASARLGGLRVVALGMAARARLDLGDHLGAVGLLEGTVGEHPLDEHLHALLALGLYRAGRQADALRVVDRVRRALADVAGLDPGPALRELEADLLAHAPTLDWRPATSTEAAAADPAVPLGAAPPAGPAVEEAPGAPPPAPPADGPGTLPGRALVGREGELRTLTGALTAAAAGRGTAAAVVGEAGIGKTRLVEELAAEAHARGFVTAWARCPESGATPPFWSAAQLAAQVREAGAVEGALVPPADRDEAAAAGTLFAMYQAVVSSLRAAVQPLLLVVDDLQWADADSLRLLSHVAGELARLRVLVVVTVRPLADHNEPALVDGLAALARTPGAVHLQLQGLSPAAVAEWLGGRPDVAVPAEVAEVVHERTEGHPLFVKELSELLAAEGSLGDTAAVRSARAIPPGVQFVVRRRVARLAVASQQLLSVASVVGRTFDLAVVATVTDESLDATLDALAPALDTGLVLEEAPGRFRFSHVLVSEALAAEVNAARRARIHAAAARALAERAGPTLGPSAALVAHHALEGAMAGTAELAVEASAEAARLAAARFGYEDAAGHWARVVDALEAARPGDLEARVDALCHLATARFGADLVAPAKHAAIAAIELAEVAGDRAAMGRAAGLLGSPHLWPNQGYGTVDPRSIATLERTVAAVDPDDRCTRARVLGALAVELTYGERPDIERARAAAVAEARACGDPHVLGRVLLNAAGPLEPSKLEQRRASAIEVLELAADHGLADEVVLVARFQLALACYEDADVEAATAHVEECRAAAARIGGGPTRAQLGWFRAGMALAQGRFDEAERLGRESVELYRRTRRVDAELIELALVASLAADRGGVEQLMPLMASAGQISPHYARLTAEFSAWLTLETGATDAAAGIVARIDDDQPFADDYTLLAGASFGLHARAGLGDRDGVAAIMPQLERYSGRWAALGSAGGSGGLVDLALARGAALLGDASRAARLFERTVAGHERLRTPAWLARSLLHHGRFLLLAGGLDDGQGLAALDRAAALADAHGLPYVARQVAEARAGH
jgi:DNA-binding SARP family transcriptional activator/class 3 adenylate cyclase/tetratricopeptide (TPR) repeat protein